MSAEQLAAALPAPSCTRRSCCSSPTSNTRSRARAPGGHHRSPRQGKSVDRIAPFSRRARSSPPASSNIWKACSARTAWVDAQELYYQVKYEKSDVEMRPHQRTPAWVADAMMRAMLAVMRPRPPWRRSWPAGRNGSAACSVRRATAFKIIVGANEANRNPHRPRPSTRPINEGRLGAPRRRPPARTASPPASAAPSIRPWTAPREGYRGAALLVRPGRRRLLRKAKKWYRKVRPRSISPPRLQEKAPRRLLRRPRQRGVRKRNR